MKANSPMEFSRTLLDHWKASGGTEVAGRAASLGGLFDAFKDIPAGVLDRIARVVVREHPSCDAVLRRFAAHVHHRDDGIGDLLMVAFALVIDDGIRDEMCALYRTTASLAMQARAESRYDFAGLGHAAAGILGGGSLAAAAA